MSTVYSKCPQKVIDLANAVLCEFATHKPLLDAKVKVDLMFAQNDEGDAIKFAGAKAIGLCRKLGLKDRAAGRGDAEILLDLTWWQNANDNERRALLDHELHHIAVELGKRDDLGRPVLKLRKHDLQVGWFAVIAQRHAEHSQERIQAAQLFDIYGQAFWPGIAK